MGIKLLQTDEVPLFIPATVGFPYRPRAESLKPAASKIRVVALFRLRAFDKTRFRGMTAQVFIKDHNTFYCNQAVFVWQMIILDNLEQADPLRPEVFCQNKRQGTTAIPADADPLSRSI